MWIKSIFENKDNAIDYYENNNNLSAIYINFHIKKKLTISSMIMGQLNNKLLWKKYHN